MKSKIVEQKKNPLLGRDEFLLEIISESTPSKKQVIEELGKSADLTVVDKIYCLYGTNKFIAKVYVYSSNEAKDKYHILTKKQRKLLLEQKKKEEEERKKLKEQNSNEDDKNQEKDIKETENQDGN